MIWILLAVVFWLPVLIFAVMVEDRFCFLGQHDYRVEYADGKSEWSPKRMALKCSRCGKISD